MKRARQVRDEEVSSDSDTESDTEGTEKEPKSKRARVEPPNEGSPSNQLQSDSQVRGFTTTAEMKRHADSLNLTRVMINDLQANSDLSTGYIGGWVVGSYATSYSQGHTVNVYVRDESSTDHNTQDSKQLTIIIDGEIAELLPSMISKDYSLFVHNGEVSGNTVEFSQDLEYSLNVSGDLPRLWIVHKNAKKEGFFEQKACKSGWYEKQKRRREAVPPVLPRSPSPDNDSQDDFSCASSQSFSLPCDFGFPDSAFTDPAFNDLSPAHSHTSSESEESEDESSMASSSESSESSDEYIYVDEPLVPKRRGRTPTYQYKKLSELEQGDKKINVFGVVKEFSEPKQCRGKDVFSSMVLVDETCSGSYGVKCMSFSPSYEGLPQIRRIGDIVLLHRVFTDVYQSRLQIVNNAFSSCQRFSGRVGRSFKVHTSSRSFTFTSADKERVKQLRQWSQRESRWIARELAMVRPACPAGLVCQVTTVTQPKEKDCVLLGIWDGTKCNLSLEQRVIADQDQVISRTNPALSAMACGFEHQVIIYDEDLLQSACSLTPGSMVTINNVVAVSCGDQYELCVKSERIFDEYQSSIQVLNTGDYPHRERTATLKAVMNKQANITTTPHSKQPLLTVAELQKWSQVPVKAHVRVKVLSVVTPSLEDTVKLKCNVCCMYAKIPREMAVSEDGTSNIPCPVCRVNKERHSETPRLRSVYAIAVEVTDLSGEVIQLYIIEDEATKLLSVQPTNFYQHQQSRYRLLEKLTALTGGNAPFGRDTTQTRPWVECSVLKFEYEDTMYYFMFDTTFIPSS